MAYTGPLQYFFPVDVSGDQQISEFETAATLADFIMPASGQIEEFGVVVTEDFSAQAADVIFGLATGDKTGGTFTVRVPLTAGNLNTTLKAGDGTHAGMTAISVDADLDNGDIILCKRSLLPIQFLAGEVVRLQVTTGSTGAGGAGFLFVGVRFSGVNTEATNVWVQQES